MKRGFLPESGDLRLFDHDVRHPGDFGFSGFQGSAFAVFQGRWPHTLSVDAKHRLALPAVFRGGAASGTTEEFMVGHLTDPCLYLLTRSQHESFLERIYRHLGDSAQSRRHKTGILSCFVPVNADSNGRLTLPGWMLDEADIQKEVLLICQKSRVEIWGLQAFQREHGESGLKVEVARALEKVLAEEEQEMLAHIRGALPDGEGGIPSL